MRYKDLILLVGCGCIGCDSTAPLQMAGDAGMASLPGGGTGSSVAGSGSMPVGSGGAGSGGAGTSSAGNGSSGESAGSGGEGNAGAAGSSGGEAFAGAPGGSGSPSGGAGGGGGNSGAGGGAGPDDAGDDSTVDAPLPDLVISSDTASIEFTPALYAAEELYPGVATVVTGGIPLLLDDDNIDLGTNAETQTLRRSVARPDLRIIFTVTETFYRLIARRSAGIDDIADLVDKTIGTPAQTSAAFYVFKTLSLADLEIGTGTGQVNVVSLFPGEGMVTALAGSNPSVDAVAAWEPYPQLALDELGGTAGDGIVFQDRDVYREIVNLHSTTAKLEDPEKRRGIVAFVRSLIDATQWYRDNPALAQSYVADELGHPADLMERVWEDERFAGILQPDLLDVLEEEELWLADQENRTPRTREELAPLVDDSVAEEAMALP